MNKHIQPFPLPLSAYAIYQCVFLRARVFVCMGRVGPGAC